MYGYMVNVRVQAAKIEYQSEREQEGKCATSKATKQQTVVFFITKYNNKCMHTTTPTKEINVERPLCRR